MTLITNDTRYGDIRVGDTLPNGEGVTEVLRMPLELRITTDSGEYYGGGNRETYGESTTKRETEDK